MTSMRVAVIDVGSNTARLLVAEAGRRGVEAVVEGKAYLGLGAEILVHGGVRQAKLDEMVKELRRFTKLAREAGAGPTDVFVTAPGRQAANAEELVATVARATGHVARVLTAEDEGRYAYDGAIVTTRVEAEPVAVCDVGGGSTEIAIGDATGASWIRSVDVGSLRLTAALLPDDPPTREQLAEAERYVAEQFATLEPEEVAVALAVGGSARALARLADGSLSPETLTEVIDVVCARRADKLARRAGIDEARARTLAGGAIILREVSRRLGVPLQLGRGGLREGAALHLLETRAAA
jgi:exopolyphosphatase/guanosine-5'-triphosphate,3'-diphosphate pyrophosphatase